MPERMPDRMSAYLPDRMTDIGCQNICQIERQIDRMPEYMSDRMPWWGSHEVMYFS